MEVIDGDSHHLTQVPGSHPKVVRDQLDLVPGQKVQAFVYGDRIEFLPHKPARALRGILRGLAAAVERDEDDRV